MKVNLIDNIEKTQETEKPSILDLDFPTLIDEKQAQGDIVAPLEPKSPIEEPPFSQNHPLKDHHQSQNHLLKNHRPESKSPIEEPPRAKITY